MNEKLAEHNEKETQYMKEIKEMEKNTNELKQVIELKEKQFEEKWKKDQVYYAEMIEKNEEMKKRNLFYLK